MRYHIAELENEGKRDGAKFENVLGGERIRMETIRLNNGVDMPLIGYGTYQTPSGM